MNLRLYRIWLGLFLLCCSPALWASPDSRVVAAIGPDMSDPEASAEFEELTAKADADGSTQVLVVLKENLDNLPQTAQQQQSQQARIETEQNAVLKDVHLRRLSSVKRFKNFPFLAFSADKAELQRLRSSAHVEQIFEDKINYPASLDFSVGKIGANIARASGFTGAGQTIAIIDNGIDKSHPFLQNKVVSEACFSTRNKGQKATSTCRNRRKRDLSPNAAAIKCRLNDFACTHGTLLAGIATGNSLASNFAGSGVAPDANLMVIKADTLVRNKKVCGRASSCRIFFDSDIIRALEFVYRNRVSFNIAAVNASLGGKATRRQCRNTPIRRSTDKLLAANIAVVAASGNEGNKRRLSSPACIPGVISVGAISTIDTVLPFSNSAANLTLLAPGQDIGFIMPGVVQPGDEVVASGTSMSSAFVSGSWASLKSQNPGASVNDILGKLTSTGVPLRDPRNTIVRPRIQLDKALGL